jgi:hypothetical protein
VRVRADHDHAHRPFVYSRHSVRTPRSYQATLTVLGRRRATKACQSAQAGHSALWGQPAASPRTNRSGRTSPPRPQGR